MASTIVRCVPAFRSDFRISITPIISVEVKLQCGRARSRILADAMRLIRYADDFVVGFEQQTDEERFRKELETRLSKFGLEVKASKIKILAFGPQAYRELLRQGSKPETFDFLGLPTTAVYAKMFPEHPSTQRTKRAACVNQCEGAKTKPADHTPSPFPDTLNPIP